MSDGARHALEVAQAIQSATPRRGRPPEEGTAPESEQVLPASILRGTRGYLEKVLAQVNGCYERGWYDACAVMVRRLLETLIIEAFEKHGRATQIQNASGDFLYLRDLIAQALVEPSWNLSRNTRAALPRLKDIGDKSAHSRRFVAHRADIDKVITDLRTAVQEFVYLAGLK